MSEIPVQIRRVWFVAHMRVTWQKDIGPALRKAGKNLGRMKGRSGLELDADVDGALAAVLKGIVRPWLIGCLSAIDELVKDD